VSKFHSYIYANDLIEPIKQADRLQSEMQRTNSRTLILAVFISVLGSQLCSAALLSKHRVERVVCIGDSITEGKYAGHGGYRQILLNLLKGAD